MDSVDAMEEGAFVHPWGTLGRQGNFVFWPEKEWLNQVRTVRGLKRVRALMNVYGAVLSEATRYLPFSAVSLVFLIGHENAENATIARNTQHFRTFSE